MIELPDEVSVATLHIGANDLDIEREALALLVCERDTAVRDDELPAVALGLPLGDLVPEARLALGLDELEILPTRAGQRRADEEIGRYEVVLQARAAHLAGSVLRDDRVGVLAVGEESHAGLVQAVDRLARAHHGRFGDVPDLGYKVAGEVTVLPQLAEPHLHDAQALVREEQIADVVAADESVCDHCLEDFSVPRLEDEAGGGLLRATVGGCRHRGVLDSG